jgi:two-component system chemotaxis response regulator CheV
MAAVKKSTILLDTGTNELEVLEFTISNQHFGINVSKVKEILQTVAYTPMPNASPFVEGIFRHNVYGILTLINLGAYLGLPESDHSERDIYIITNFNNNFTAFHVHSVVAIHRITWERIEKPDATIYGGEDGLATGIARIGEKLVTIVDFEKILVEIGFKSGLGTEAALNVGSRPDCHKPIMIVEDSTFLERLLSEYLSKAGFTNIIECSNGKEAWDIIASFKESGEPVSNYLNLVITDIEMPKMDGHRLTKLIKGDEELRHLPVVIFSSLINSEMRLKGEQVGANAQISKADLQQLLPTIDMLLNK